MNWSKPFAGFDTVDLIHQPALPHLETRLDRVTMISVVQEQVPNRPGESQRVPAGPAGLQPEAGTSCPPHC
jgi:hypothetical protein